MNGNIYEYCNSSMELLTKLAEHIGVLSENSFQKKMNSMDASQDRKETEVSNELSQLQAALPITHEMLREWLQESAPFFQALANIARSLKSESSNVEDISGGLSAPSNNKLVKEFTDLSEVAKHKAEPTTACEKLVVQATYKSVETESNNSYINVGIEEYMPKDECIHQTNEQEKSDAVFNQLVGLKEVDLVSAPSTFNLLARCADFGEPTETNQDPNATTACVKPVEDMKSSQSTHKPLKVALNNSSPNEEWVLNDEALKVEYGITENPKPAGFKEVDLVSAPSTFNLLARCADFGEPTETNQDPNATTACVKPVEDMKSSQSTHKLLKVALNNSSPNEEWVVNDEALKVEYEITENPRPAGLKEVDEVLTPSTINSVDEISNLSKLSGIPLSNPCYKSNKRFSREQERKATKASGKLPKYKTCSQRNLNVITWNNSNTNWRSPTVKKSNQANQYAKSGTICKQYSKANSSYNQNKRNLEITQQKDSVANPRNIECNSNITINNNSLANEQYDEENCTPEDLMQSFVDCLEIYDMHYTIKLPDLVYLWDKPRDTIDFDTKIGQMPLPHGCFFGNVMEISITEIYTPSQFWFNFINAAYSKDALADLHWQMHSFYRSLRNPSDWSLTSHFLKPDVICTVESDGFFRRARILSSPTGSSICILLIDFGTILEVSLSNLYFLGKTFIEAPAFAVRGKIAHIQPKSTHLHWSLAAIKEFSALTKERHLYGLAINVNTQERSITWKLSTNKNFVPSISRVMVYKDLAIKMTKSSSIFGDCDALPEPMFIRSSLPSFEMLETMCFPPSWQLALLKEQDFDFEDFFDYLVYNPTFYEKFEAPKLSNPFYCDLENSLAEWMKTFQLRQKNLGGFYRVPFLHQQDAALKLLKTKQYENMILKPEP